MSNNTGALPFQTNIEINSMLPRRGGPTFPFGVFSLLVLFALRGLFATCEKYLAYSIYVFSNEWLRGEKLLFCVHLCVCCLGSCFNGLRKRFELNTNLLHTSDYPLYLRIHRQSIWHII